MLRAAGECYLCGMSHMTKWAPDAVYSSELVAEVLLRLAEGKSLWATYDSDRVKYPHPNTWNEWCSADSDLRIAHVRAKELGADRYVDEAMSLLNAPPERVTLYNDKGEPDNGRIDPSAVVLAKARADIRMKRAAQINPREYGDKQLHAGFDGGAIKSETALSLPEMIERLRLAKRVEPEAPVTIEQRVIEPDAALLEHANPSRSTISAPAGLEPGDPGMEFV